MRGGREMGWRWEEQGREGGRWWGGGGGEVGGRWGGDEETYSHEFRMNHAAFAWGEFHFVTA